MTNSKNSFELTAFCGGVVSGQDVFLCEFELCVSKLFNNNNNNNNDILLRTHCPYHRHKRTKSG